MKDFFPESLGPKRGCTLHVAKYGSLSLSLSLSHTHTHTHTHYSKINCENARMRNG